MEFQNESNHLREMVNLRNSNQDPPVDLYDLKGSDKGDIMIDSLTMEPFDTFLMRDKVISTTPKRENEEFLKSSVNDLVLIPRESEITSVCDDFEFDLLMENEDVAGLPRHLVKYLFNYLLKNPSLTKGMSDEPLDDDSKPRSYDVTFSNPLFDFNDDSTLCYDNPLFDEEFEDITSLDLPESTPVIDESSLLVTPLPDPKHICLREVERFDPFFTLT
ncbi:hypothetical protein Tco_0065936 [Tanacetum coccineum]